MFPTTHIGARRLAGLVGLDRQDGALGVEQDLLTVASEHQFAHRTTAAQPDDHEVGVLLVDDAQQVRGRVVAPNQGPDLD